MRGVSGVEHDLDFIPEGVHPIARDRIEHIDEIDSGRYGLVRLINDVDRLVTEQDHGLGRPEAP